MQIQEFIERWRSTQAAERANKDSYLKELCRVLGVPEPDGKTNDPERDHYVFEADAVVYDEDGRRHVGKMDLFRRGHFVLEAKQGAEKGSKGGTAKWGTPGWNLAMTEAAGQAFGYARTLDEPPPFVLVADIGQCFDLYACFDGSGAYRAFPNAQKNRLWLKELDKHADLFRKIWLDPHSLDPRRHSERVSQEVAADLAKLAVSLEAAGHDAGTVARFLMRCIFTMFAEDIGLLQDKVFTQYLDRQWLQDPASFKDGIEELWAAMNAGKRFYVLGKLLRFNGGLFADPIGIALDIKQLKVLASAARHDWSEVDPAIFGTLIERALNPKERHSLGAYFTPPEYVRRLLVPAIEEPLRASWELVRVRVRELVPPGLPARPANVTKATAAVEEFRTQLCQTVVLDPACGTGNFLYVAFHLLKQLESEVLATLDDLGAAQLELEEESTVTPRQFLGIELRAGSKEIAELVLWIGYLQWHHRMFGGAKRPPEPILRDYKNIAHGDAIIEADRVEPVVDASGKPLTRWNGQMTVHPVTLKEIPDEAGQEPRRKFVNPRSRQWPKADFIVGNPPYIGVRVMKNLLKEEYVEALRLAYPNVPETSDLVMYWWHLAAEAVGAGRASTFALITTKSITQDYSRPVIEHHIGDDGRIDLSFAIAEHPWCKAPGGAAVSVAMTVGQRRGASGTKRTLGRVTTIDANRVEVAYDLVDAINSSLTSGTNVRNLQALEANDNLCFQGVVPANDGFKLDRSELKALGISPSNLPPVVRRYIIGNDLVRVPKEKFIIDMYGHSEEEARRRWPRLYQHLRDHVWHERQQNPRASYRDKWWLFAEPRPNMRQAIGGLSRFIVTPYTAKHRPFVFVDAETIPDAMAYAIASDDAFVLGVLSSKAHAKWSRATGGKLETRPRYNSTRTLLPFPFPICDAALRAVIAELAEEIDAHRKRQQSADPSLTLTIMYNILDKLAAGVPLTAKEKATHEAGLLGILRKLHDDLDASVQQAYGCSAAATEEAVMSRIIALNAERADEEQRGTVRSLGTNVVKRAKGARRKVVGVSSNQLVLPWPEGLPHQVAAVRDLLTFQGAALTANDVATSYSGATEPGVVAALQTLEALGIAASFETSRGRCWKGLARSTGERTSTPEERTRSSSRPPAGSAAVG